MLLNPIKFITGHDLMKYINPLPSTTHFDHVRVQIHHPP